MIQRSLVNFYVRREFSGVTKKPHRRTKKKPLQQ
jgi:hypothetical protein